MLTLFRLSARLQLEVQSRLHLLGGLAPGTYIRQFVRGMEHLVSKRRQSSLWDFNKHTRRCMKKRRRA